MLSRRPTRLRLPPRRRQLSRRGGAEKREASIGKSVNVTAADDVRLRERNDEVAAEALRFELRHQLVGDMPGKEQRVVGILVEETRLVDDRNDRSGNVLADLERALDLDDAVEQSVVETDVIDQRARPRRSTDAEDPLRFRLDAA